MKTPREGCFPVASREKAFSFSGVETAKLTESQREALLTLLDDPSTAVRKGLLTHFLQLGKEAADLLQQAARSPNRVLARHASLYLTELKFSDPVAEFNGFIRSLNYELETGALLLARTVSPDLDVGASCRTLDDIAARCRELISEPATPREKCRIMNRVLFHEWEFHGNVEHYTDPLNSFLDQVLIRRKGIPLSLSLVYLLVAERLGLELEPVALPGHFLVGCYLENEPFFIDPFDKGVFRDGDEVFDLLRSNHLVPQVTDLSPTPVREVLCRSCRNLVNHYTNEGQSAHAALFAGFVAEFETAYEKNSA